jgi:drug/metabolite transporter (DMT)-like permease
VSLPMILACLVLSASLAGGQVLFKLAAGDLRERLSVSWFDAALSPWLISALLLYALSTALWLYILAHVPLTRAYPFALFGTAIVPLLAWLTLGEPLPALYLLGIAVVIGGLAIIQLS